MAPVPRDRRGLTSNSTAAVPPRVARVSTHLAAAADREYCKTCKIWLPTYDAWVKHLVQNGNHIACWICHYDYQTAEALKRHMDQNHAAEQSLTCPGCNKVFNRLGGMMSHMELKECVVLRGPGNLIEELRVNNPRSSGMFDTIKAAGTGTAWENIESATSAQFHSGNVSPPSQYVAGVSARAHAASPVDSFLQNLVREQAAVVDEEEDLIDFDAPSLVLNAPWDQPLVSFNTATDFPPLIQIANKSAGPGAKKEFSSPNGTTGHGQTVKVPGNSVNGPASFKAIVARTPAPVVPAAPVWDMPFKKAPASTVLFLNALPAVAPPAALMQSLAISVPSDESFWAEHDPHDPKFKASRYYDEYVRGYKCPHSASGCKKSFPTVTAFVQHLKSLVHAGLQSVTCQHCLRPFPCATALTQHIESQGVKCNARKLDHIGFMIEDVTQVATADGRHGDETVKYVNLPDPLNPQAAAAAVRGGAARFVAANRRAVDAVVEHKKNAAEEMYHTEDW